MNIKEKAKIFAIKAHQGQQRKSEPDKPMIMHPLRVGKILEEFGYDDNVIAAGYLHDVVEDTQFTIEDIEREFGTDIANLVMGASEPDKSLSWEERKKHTIETTKNLPLRNKLVICADKIDNVEDLYLHFEKIGKKDYSVFKRGEKEQKWYYTSIYKSIIENEDETLPIFEKLKSRLNKVFYKKEDIFLKDYVFGENPDYYENLIKLHSMKEELQKMKSLVSLSKPYVIEFSGTPRTGKTSIINNLYEFFKKGNFDIEIIPEFTTSQYYKEEFRKKHKEKNSGELNFAIIEEVYKQLQESMNHNKEIILIDRSINDRQIWNYTKYRKNEMSESLYLELREKYKSISKEYIDFLSITYANPLVSLKRDYLSSLNLEKRSFLNIENIEDYNYSLKSIEDLLKESVEDLSILDTSNMSMHEVSTKIAFAILNSMRKKYIKTFNKDNDTLVLRKREENE